MHILVVEDERRLAALLRRVFTEERHTVDLAVEGRSGLDLALSGTYDLVILDLMLPEVDGIEICRQMRAEKIETPVLMLTARGAVEDRVRGLNIGADDYLTKPFALEELLARVNALLRRRSRPMEERALLHVGDVCFSLLCAGHLKFIHDDATNVQCFRGTFRNSRFQLDRRWRPIDQDIP